MNGVKMDSLVGDATSGHFNPKFLVLSINSCVQTNMFYLLFFSLCFLFLYLMASLLNINVLSAMLLDLDFFLFHSYQCCKFCN
ncbi:hypothetical protein XENTR_v10003070 [Xenopus tropicalis]|nr:hypothetical protein XENTR_v10003070 [Xenopus tropicalis]